MPPPTKKNNLFKQLLRYFLQGFLILAPIAITVFLLYTLFDKVDQILRPYVNIPGLGFVIIMAFIIFVGYISTNFLMGSIIHFFDYWLDRTPGVKFVYTSIKDFFQAFAGDKKKFNKSVLANVIYDDVWVIGFVTDEELGRFELGSEYVSVYVPQAYNFAGQLYILPRSKVRTLPGTTSADAMKYAVTGGVVEVENS